MELSTQPELEEAIEDYHPMINSASGPLPIKKCNASSSSSSSYTSATASPTLLTITLTTPNDGTTTTSDSPSPTTLTYQEEVLDASRLHPNAAWPQLAQWTHKQNLRLSKENDMLRTENEALKSLLGRFGRTFATMGMGEQMDFLQKLRELPIIPPKSEGGGPRGPRQGVLDQESLILPLIRTLPLARRLPFSDNLIVGQHASVSGDASVKHRISHKAITQSATSS